MANTPGISDEHFQNTFHTTKVRKSATEIAELKGISVDTVRSAYMVNRHHACWSQKETFSYCPICATEGWIYSNGHIRAANGEGVCWNCGQREVAPYG